MATPLVNKWLCYDKNLYDGITELDYDEIEDEPEIVALDENGVVCATVVA